MKVLVITNLAPTKENPMSGIFVVKRLQQYAKFCVDYLAISLGFEERWDVRLLKKLLRKSSYTRLDRLLNVKFEPILIPWNLAKLLLHRTHLIDNAKLTQEYAHRIEFKLSDFQFDLIHAHGMYEIPAAEIAYFLARKHDKPFVVSLHGSDVNLLMPKRKQRYIEILESASKCIFVSNKLLETAKSFGYSGKNAVVIPNGYDPEIFKPMDKNKVRKELGIHKDNYKYVGFVGNLISIKRADKLEKIFNLIAKEIPETFFIVVGDGPLREKIKKETKGLNIIFTGRLPQKDVAKYMNAMDVMVLPSRNEGFGCVVLEAQACGTCVIGSSNGGIPEAIGFEEYVVEEGDNFEERFAQRVVEVLKKGYNAAKLIARAQEYTWRRIVEMEIDVYREVWSRKI
ncbi:glycosyl transferase group 1 [Thermotoga sp. Ku-13t]|uniref:glycosyltransferase family 4 protein n=1 Tax=Thermotoga sp. Ku-13t TaxID=1755813 RepID=UPI0013EE08C7|nr:glycosyltransferase family 4 protein [Thermotoga sp. Ku-13t]KAF2958602.1 glycosyl transferase group 1 [Thermotoga sp. Ku-13t]